MKRIFAKRFLTVLAFLFAFALLINANVAKANAEGTGATVTTEPVSVNEKIQEFIDAANALEPEYSSWDDKYYDDTAFLKKVEVASKIYAGLTNSEIEEAYKQSKTAKTYYEFVVITKKFQEQIEVSNAINALTGRVNGVLGYEPINEIDRNTVDSVKVSYDRLSRDSYVKQTSDPSYIQKALDEVEKCRINNEAAKAAIKNIEYLLNGAMEKDASGEIVLASKATFKAAEDAMAKVAVRDYVLIKETIINGNDITTIDLLAQFQKAKTDYYALYDKITATKDLIIELHDTKAVITNKTIYTNRADILKLKAMYEELQELEANGNGFNDVYQELLSLASGLDTKYDALIDAYNDLLAAIKNVEDLIDVLDGIADADIYTPQTERSDPDSSYQKMNAARKAFNALPQDVKDASEEGEKDAVENYADLVAFEDAWDDKVQEILDVDDAIVKAYNLFKKAEVNTDVNYKLEETLGNVNKMYTDLSPRQRVDVTKVAELEYCRAVSAKNSSIANDIDAKIQELYDELPTAGIDPIYISEVEDVRDQYEALTESQKAYVKKEPLLKEIEDELTKRLAGLDSWYEAITEAIEACYDENGDVALVYGEGENYEKVVAVKNLWEPLTKELKDAATSKYPTEVAKYDELVAKLKAKYDAVEDLANRMAGLKALKDITLDVNDLDAYVAKVEACTTELKALGTFAELLKEKYADAYENYVKVSTNDAPAAKVEKAIIEALVDVNGDYKADLTIADANAVETANKEYEKLTDEQKALVRNYEDDEDDTAVNTLEEALAIIAEITEKLNAWIEKVEALVESTKATVANQDIIVVDLVNGALNELEDEYAKFNADEQTYAPIVAAKAKLDAVRAGGVAVVEEPKTGLNDRIQAVIAFTTFTADDITELNAIKSIYDAITESQQALVVDYDKFLDVYQIVVIKDTFEDLVKDLDEALNNNNGEVTEEMVIMVKIVKSIYAQHDLGSIISKEVKDLYDGLAAKVEGKTEINLIDAINALKNSDANLSTAIEALEAAYAAADADTKEALKQEVEAAKSDLQSKLDAQKEALEKAIDDAKKAASEDLTKAQAELKAAYESADKDIQDAYKAAIEKATTDLQGKLDAQKVELEKAIEDAAAALAANDSQLSSLISTIDTNYKNADEAIKTAYAAAIKEAKEALEKALSDQKAELDAAIKAAQSASSTEISTTKKQLEDAYAAADEVLKGEYSTAIKEAEDTLNAALEAQKAELNAAIEAVKKAANDELTIAKAALEEAYKNADSSLQTEYKAAVDAAKSELQQAIDAVKAQLEAKTAELEKAISDLDKSQKTATVVICVVFGLISAGLGTCVFILFKRKVA